MVETGNTRTCEICKKVIKQISIPVFDNKFITVYPACKCQVALYKKEKEDEEKRRIKDRIERLFKQSRLGERFQEATFENYQVNSENKSVYEKMKSYAENWNGNKENSILLHGGAGTGKTHLSACIINHLVKQLISTVFVVVPDLLNQIRTCYNVSNRNPEINEYNIMTGLQECDLLVLDDLGAEKHTGEDDWANERLFSIINNRYLHKKATIFTSNYTLNQLHARLTSRTFSRIFEMTKGNVHNFDGKDIRLYGLQRS
jgi:DNA replication protein DnaC